MRGSHRQLRTCINVDQPSINRIRNSRIRELDTRIHDLNAGINELASIQLLRERAERKENRE